MQNNEDSSFRKRPAAAPRTYPPPPITQRQSLTSSDLDQTATSLSASIISISSVAPQGTITSSILRPDIHQQLNYLLVQDFTQTQDFLCDHLNYSSSTNIVQNMATVVPINSDKKQPTKYIKKENTQDNGPKVKRSVDTVTQTDIHMDPFVSSKSGCVPDFAETESTSFYYKNEPQISARLAYILSDLSNSAPCLKDVADAPSIEPGSRSLQRSPQRSPSRKETRAHSVSASTQTLSPYSNSSSNTRLQDVNKSTQTSTDLSCENESKKGDFNQNGHVSRQASKSHKSVETDSYTYESKISVRNETIAAKNKTSEYEQRMNKDIATTTNKYIKLNAPMKNVLLSNHTPNTVIPKQPLTTKRSQSMDNKQMMQSAIEVTCFTDNSAISGVSTARNNKNDQVFNAQVHPDTRVDPNSANRSSRYNQYDNRNGRKKPLVIECNDSRQRHRSSSVHFSDDIVLIPEANSPASSSSRTVPVFPEHQRQQIAQSSPQREVRQSYTMTLNHSNIELLNIDPEDEPRKQNLFDSRDLIDVDFDSYDQYDDSEQNSHAENSRVSFSKYKNLPVNIESQLEDGIGNQTERQSFLNDEEYNAKVVEEIDFSIYDEALAMSSSGTSRVLYLRHETPSSDKSEMQKVASFRNDPSRQVLFSDWHGLMENLDDTGITYIDQSSPEDLPYDDNKMLATDRFMNREHPQQPQHQNQVSQSSECDLKLLQNLRSKFHQQQIAPATTQMPLKTAPLHQSALDLSHSYNYDQPLSALAGSTKRSHHTSTSSLSTNITPLSINLENNDNLGMSDDVQLNNRQIRFKNPIVQQRDEEDTTTREPVHPVPNEQDSYEAPVPIIIEERENHGANNNTYPVPRIVRLMNTAAEREYYKLLRRIERRQVRVPEILDLLKIVKSDTKEKRKLEDELRLLMRKSERDQVLIRRYLAVSPSEFNHQRGGQSMDDLNKSANNITTIHSRSLSRSNENLVADHDFLNKSLTSLANLDARVAARESGYSSCESGTESRQILRLKKQPKKTNHAFVSDLNTLDDVCEATMTSPQAIETSHFERQHVETAIRKAMHNVPNSHKLSRSPVQFTEYLDNDHALPQMPSLSPKMNELLLEMPSVRAQQPASVLISSSSSGRQRHFPRSIRNETPDSDNNENEPEEHLRIGNNQQSTTSYITSSDSITHVPNINNRFIDGNNVSGRSVPSTSQQQVSNRNNPPPRPNTNAGVSSTGPTTNNRQNYSLNNGNVSNSNNYYNNNSDSNNRTYPRSSNYVINSSQPSAADASEFRTEFVTESQLGANYRQNYQVSKDYETGELYIMDYQKKVKYIIVNEADKESSPKRSKSNDQTLTVDYVELDDLGALDLSQFEIYENASSGESLLYDIRERDVANRQEYVILTQGWRESPQSPYLAQEDIDMRDLDIYEEKETGRKYIIDDKSGLKYYLVDSKSLEKFRKKYLDRQRVLDAIAHSSVNRDNAKLGTFMNKANSAPGKSSHASRMTNNYSNAPRMSSRSPNKSNSRSTSNDENRNPKEYLADSQQVVHLHNHDPNQIESVGYVEEQELESVDLHESIVFQDDEIGEPMLSHLQRRSHRWVILPENWRTSESSPYVSEDDVNLMEWDVYMDGITKRQYIIDEKSGQRLFLVNEPKTEDATFKAQWNRMLNSIAAEAQLNAQAAEKLPRSNLKHISPAQKNVTRAKPFDVSDKEIIRNFDAEPSIYKLNATSEQSPQLENYKAIIHAPLNVRMLTTPKKQIQRSPNNKQSSKSRSKSPPGKQKAVSSKTVTQQEAARRAFLAQKIPHMGKLWLHQQLIDGLNKKQDMLRRYRNRGLADGDNLNKDPNYKAWETLARLKHDPTLDSNNELDRYKLDDLQMYGYSKFGRNYKDDSYGAYGKEDDLHGYHLNAIAANSKGGKSNFGGDAYPFARGILTEHCKETRRYVPRYLDPYHRALVPQAQLHLREQFLLTPRYLKDSWKDSLAHSDRMKPRIIVINDEERILTANKNCNVYIQYMYDNDAVLGCHPAYQLMLPERGPVSPTRPLLISPRQQTVDVKNHTGDGSNGLQPEIALREAPVFVYHSDGSAFYENIAQYLGGRHPQLTPHTARKILQFSDMKEFEDYLAARITRDEAKRLAEESGDAYIDVDAIKHDLRIAAERIHRTRQAPLLYHSDCEYDSLRNDHNDSMDNGRQIGLGNETLNIEIAGHKIKSTFIGLQPTGQVEPVDLSELPQSVLDAMAEAARIEEVNRRIEEEKLKYRGQTPKNKTLSLSKYDFTSSTNMYSPSPVETSAKPTRPRLIPR